jgi:hypothetical protein
VHTQTPQISASGSPEIVYQQSDVVQVATSAVTVVSCHRSITDAARHPAEPNVAAHLYQVFRKSPIGLPSSRVNTRSTGRLPSTHIEMTAWTSCVILMTRASLFFVAPGVQIDSALQEVNLSNAEFVERFGSSPTIIAVHGDQTSHPEPDFRCFPCQLVIILILQETLTSVVLLKHRETGHTKHLRWSGLIAKVEPWTKQRQFAVNR